MLFFFRSKIQQISSSPQRQIKQNAASSTTVHLATNQTTGSVSKTMVRLTESYLPATMQALAYYIELLQYEPLHMTTVEPPFTVSTTPLTLPNVPSSSTPRPPVQQPVTWWSPPSTTQRPTASWTQPTSSWWTSTTQKPPTFVTWTTSPWTTKKPVTWWTPPTTTTRKPVEWVSISYHPTTFKSLS